MVPQPVKAVVLLFPITEKNEAKKKDEDEAILTGKLPPVDPTVIWIKQTVSDNMRGLYKRTQDHSALSVFL